MVDNKVLLTKKPADNVSLVSLIVLNLLPLLTLLMALVFSPLEFSSFIPTIVLFSITIPLSIYLTYYYRAYFDVYITPKQIVFERNDKVITYEIEKYKEIQIESKYPFEKISGICYFRIDKKEYKVMYELKNRLNYSLVDLMYKQNQKEDSLLLHKKIEDILKSMPVF